MHTHARAGRIAIDIYLPHMEHVCDNTLSTVCCGAQKLDSSLVLRNRIITAHIIICPKCLRAVDGRRNDCAKPHTHTLRPHTQSFITTQNPAEMNAICAHARYHLNRRWLARVVLSFMSRAQVAADRSSQRLLDFVLLKYGSSTCVWFFDSI